MEIAGTTSEKVRKSLLPIAKIIMNQYLLCTDTLHQRLGNISAFKPIYDMVIDETRHLSKYIDSTTSIITMNYLTSIP